MSVLIKGMEMPINCDSCRIMVLEDTNCNQELFCGCPLVFKAHPQGEDHRPDYCPLASVPPHGDLIDRDAMIRDIQKALAPSWYIKERNADMVKFLSLEDTIIPAEGKPIDTEFWGEEYAEAKGFTE